MKKGMLCVTIMMSVVLFLAPLAQTQSKTEMICEGSGYFYASIAGSGCEAGLQWSMPYGTRDDALTIRKDVLTIDGTSYMGMQYANSLTVDRLMIVNNGYVEFEQSYSDGSSDLGYFGTFLGTDADEMGILYTSGFFVGALANTNFLISQYAGKYSPDINTSLTMNNVGEGLGCSQMSVTLYSDWVYSPSTGIFEYWQNSLMGGVPTTDYVTVQLRENDELLTDISSTWTVPWIEIDIYTEL